VNSLSDVANENLTRPSTLQPLGWAILGPGRIARKFLTELSAGSGRLVAVGSSNLERANQLADEAADLGFSDVVSGTYDDAINAPGVDAVYVSTVHTGHAALVLAALSAGKAVLCEKPMSPNFGTTMALVDAARERGRPLVEAYMYRFHPQTAALLDIVRSGEIGAVTRIEARYSFRVEGREGRLFTAATAGGGILDVGGYPVTLANAVVAAASGVPTAEPLELHATGTVGSTGVDEWTVANLEYADGITATLRAALRVNESHNATVFGTRGKIELSDPWTLTDRPTIVVSTVADTPRTLTFSGQQSYALEAQAVADAVVYGGSEAMLMPLSDTLAAARTLDRWRDAISLRFPFEAEDANILPVNGRPLTVENDSLMRYGTIPGIDKQMSRLVMGVDNQPDLAHASAIFDHFFSRGGNTFDTAFIYGLNANHTSDINLSEGGELQGRFGKWVQNRGIRSEVVVIMKGAHTPYCDPASLSEQLTKSLERQGTDYADIYMMHRDNPDVPVGEFVDVLDEHRRAGRIRVYGASNWTPERVDEANAYARATGKFEFSVLSDHFSLARAYDVQWPGCVQVTDDTSRRWLEERQIPLLPWSSQARGFFTGRARPEDRSDSEMVRCYYSDDNFERLRRATELGRELGVPATAVALAYVLHQPFPTFPLFGPRTIAEARSSMQGLTVELSPQTVAWLDLREDKRRID
jgi:aryl-alcohol dehydrogenase-like predicted oxidoreductase/predicted dehydrogenase